MSRWANDPELAARELIAGTLDELALSGRVLLAPATAELRAVVVARGVDCHVWARRVNSGFEAMPEPEEGPFDAALLRLPKSRDESHMAAHLCLGVLGRAGRLIVYGGNDEGVRAFQKWLGELGPVETIAARGHGRVLQLHRANVAAPLRARLSDWREEHVAPGHPRPWISYPGLFAGGEPDAGTALLLRNLPPIAAGARVLDYGCGPGAISFEVLRRQPSAQVTMLDNDSVALAAARENASGAKYVLADKLPAATRETFDLIVSNPPLHIGFRETTVPLTALINAAPAALTPAGQLVMVVQRRIGLETILGEHFGKVEVLADNGRYRVWRVVGGAAV